MAVMGGGSLRVLWQQHGNQLAKERVHAAHWGRE